MPAMAMIALAACTPSTGTDAGGADAGRDGMDAGARDGGPPVIADAGIPDGGARDAFSLPDGHVVGTPLSITASSSAAAHPIANAIDGDPATSWVAFDTTGPHANYAWVEVDFGVAVHVERIRLSGENAPPPGRLPSHFVVWVFDGGRWWHAASRFDALSAPSLDLAIARNAVRVRIEVSRVDDGSGAPAAIDELSFDTLPEPVVTTPPACDVTLAAGTDLIAFFADVTNAHDQTVCVEAGTYPGPVWIHQARALTVRALGPVTIEAERSGLDMAGGAAGTLIVTQADGLLIEGLRVVNQHHFVQPYSNILETWSRAVEVLDSHDVRFVDAEIESFGKQTTWITRSSGVVLEDVSIAGAYFLVCAVGANVVLNRSSFHGDLSFALPDDYHAPIWPERAAMFLRDTTVDLVTGNGLIGGPQPADNLFVQVSGTFRATGMTEWVQSHPQYPNLRLQLGADAPALEPFFYNPFQGGGLGAGTELCRFGDTPTCVYPSL